MKIFPLCVVAIFLTIEFFGCFAAWMKSKSKREYWLRFVDTAICGGVLVGFVGLVEVLVK